MGRPTKWRQVRLSAEQKEDIRQKCLSGVPHSALLAEYGCSKSALHYITRDLRIGIAISTYEAHVAALQAVEVSKLGWAAGIVDGEGYIGLVPSKRGNIMPRIDISSTTPVMQEHLAEILGVGLIYARTIRKHRPRERPQTTWAVWSVPTVGFILEVLTPHLVVKRQVAEVVLDFCRRRLPKKQEAYEQKDFDAIALVRQLNGRIPKCLALDETSKS
jgi:hypothetical protein